MSQEVADAVRAAGAAAIAVNNTFRLAPWADMLYAADEQWWRLTPEAHAFAGLKVSVTNGISGVLYLRTMGHTGYCDEQDCLHTYGNSGAQAIQIAAKAGAARILLCGFDMQGSHWHGRHPNPLNNAEPELFDRWIKRMQELAPALESRGVKVVNCTPGSRLKCFAMANLNECLNESSLSRSTCDA